MNKHKHKTWLDNEIDFYDFIWKEGISACAYCINKELLEDIHKGGDKFELMTKKILQKFPTRKEAEKAFIKCKN